MATHDLFLERAELELAELNRADQALASQEDGIRRRRSEIEARISELDRALDVYREVMGLNMREAPTKPLFESESLPQGSVAEMALAAIQRAGGPMKVREIVDALRSAGKFGESDGRQQYATVFGILRRDKRFTKSGQGSFDVSERARVTGDSVREERVTQGLGNGLSNEPVRPLEQSHDVALLSA